MMMIKTFITSILIKEGKAYVEGKKIQIRKIQGKKSFTLSMIRCSISKPWITRGIQKTSHFCYLNSFYVPNVDIKFIHYRFNNIGNKVPSESLIEIYLLGTYLSRDF